LLNFHRRIEKATSAMDRLLEHDSTAKRFPRGMHNLAAKFHSYMEDKVVKEAAKLYEQAYEIFHRLRRTLRLSVGGPCPLSEGYQLDGRQAVQVQESLEQLLREYTEIAEQLGQTDEGKLYQTVVSHLNKYWQRLNAPAEQLRMKNKQVRTTNELETEWRWAKRNRRRTNGRSKLTRDFQALPCEYMLVNNLRNDRYVQLVLGSLSALPAKLAEAGQRAGPFSKWRKQNRTMAPGRLPKKLLRQQNYLDDLTDSFAIESNTLN
jgi:hypothetical protein